MTKTYSITDSFGEFYQKCKTQNTTGLKVIAFPTGMGKTYGSAYHAVQVAENGDLPIFIAPRIDILKDFEKTILSNFKQVEVVRIIANYELQQVEYYCKNREFLEKIVDSINDELCFFIKINCKDLPSDLSQLDAYFNQLGASAIKKNKEYSYIYKIRKASKNITSLYRQLVFLKNNTISEENRNELKPRLLNAYNGIIDIFEASNFFYIKQYKHGIFKEDGYKIWGFSSFDKQIVKDFFGLSFVLDHIKNNQKNDRYILIITSKKSLKYIGRTFEFKQNKPVNITGNSSNNLSFNRYINTFCKANQLNPIYYIDEADVFYKEIIEDRTTVIYLNNFFHKIETLFAYSNLSNLLDFIEKIEKYKNIAPFLNDFKELMFNYKNIFTATKVENLISFLISNKIKLNTDQVLNNKIINKLNEKIENDIKLKDLFKNIKNKGNALFIFLLFVEYRGINDKIQQLEDIEKEKNVLFLGDLYKIITSCREFFEAWHTDQDPLFKLNSTHFFKELKIINILLKQSSLGEAIIKDEDFFEIDDDHKFMFGNDSLSLFEEQIKYLDKFVSIEHLSGNIILEITSATKEKLTLSYIFSFLTKVLIRTVQEIKVPFELFEEDDILEKEIYWRTSLKKIKTAVSSIKKITDSQYKIKEYLLFDKEYIYESDKNVINLYAKDYIKNMSTGKPSDCTYLQISNIHLKDSPEKELLNYFSTIEYNEVKDFTSNSVVYLMSATATINSYHGNFDYEYLTKKLASNHVKPILYDTTYLNTSDIELVNNFKQPFLNKELTEISYFDYGVYENKPFDLYTDFSQAIKNSNSKPLEILNGSRDYHKYKLYEFQSFVYSLELLITNSDINSLFFISQTTKNIINFIKDFESCLLNKSSKLIRKLEKNGKPYENIFVINKESFNSEYLKHPIDKDIIIIFYDSTFESKQQATLEDKEIDVSDTDLDDLDNAYNDLKNQIFNEDDYKVLLCSSFGSVSKGFNFVTNSHGKEKDFDSIMIGMDPYYDNLSEKKDELLVYQRIVAMKDFNHVNQRASNLKELMDYFYLNKNNLLRKEHLASIARVIIQSLGRIERRRHQQHNKKQYLFINTETAKNMEHFYQFYEYDRYINNTQTIKEDNFSSNLSVNNQYLFDSIKKEIGKTRYLNDYKSHVDEQISKIIMLNELVSFLLTKIRRNNKTRDVFKEIWDLLKDTTLFHDLPTYLKNLEEKVEPRLFELEKHIQKEEFPNLWRLVTEKTYKLRDIFFAQFPKETKIGLSIEKCTKDEYHDVVVDYFHANKSEYNLFNIIFNAEKEDFSTEVLKYIPWLKTDLSIETLFRSKYTIGDTLYIPQKKIAIEFIKAALSEEIFKKVLDDHNIKYQMDIGTSSYELFDMYITYKSKITAIDIKYWSTATQAVYSKDLNDRVDRKEAVLASNSIHITHKVIVNFLGKTDDDNIRDDIHYFNMFNKNKDGKYILNKNIINFLKQEIEK